MTGKISGENHPFVEHFKFVKQFETDFTYDIGGVNKESARYTREYMQIREEILNIINEQNETLKL